jgi:hypothetical protein
MGPVGNDADFDGEYISQVDITCTFKVIGPSAYFV